MTIALGGWASGPWGSSPWGGYLAATGGVLPTAPPFDIFCFGQGTPVSQMFTYPDVEYTGSAAHFLFDPSTGEVGIGSGGTFPDEQLEVSINGGVPASFTLQFTARFDALPLDFSNMQYQHVYFGAANPGGAAAALFISQAGLLYTGGAHTEAGALLFDSVLQPLPNSQTLISLGEYITIRIACDFESGTTYIYVTPTADLPSTGHRLRYVVPGFVAADLTEIPLEEVSLKIRGTVADPSIYTLAEIGLGTGLVIPNIPPRAHAGTDQAVRTCSIARLDGSQSFDAQGAPLTYLWQLVDAPLGSTFDFYGVDGDTHPLMVPTGFTDKFHAASLEEYFEGDPFVIDDVVLIIAGTPHTIDAVGTDVDGFYVRAIGYELPDNLPAGTPFKIIRQRGLSGSDTAKPTFYPDVPGLYKFRLVVGNTVLQSLPAETILNVTESVLPHGITPDLRFLWDYLSDFWKLVEDRERIEVFWGALAQTAAAELLNLWQIDYNKSLRDIQRTVQRKWLHYDLGFYQSAAHKEDTTLRAIYGGIASSNILLAGTSEPAGKILVLDIDGIAQPVTISFPGVGPFSAAHIATRITAVMAPIDNRVRARVVARRDGVSSMVRIDAPFLVGINAASTTALFNGTNGAPQGTGGAAAGPRIYRVEKSLEGLAVVANNGSVAAVTDGDFLVIGENTYRIARIIDDPSDPYSYQRLTLLDDVPSDIGPNWAISGQVYSPDIDFYTALASLDDSALFELTDLDTNGTAVAQAPVLGASAAAANTMGVDLSILGRYIAEPTRFTAYFSKLSRRRHIPTNSLVVDVPYLQDKIKITDPQAVLRRNVDFFLDTFRGLPCVRFATSVDPTRDVWEGELPPDRLWAEITYLDNRQTIENNFGLPAEFTQDDLAQLPSNVDYLSAVRGLWYAYFTGATVFNLRVGAQILLGLPFAEEAGVIEEIRNDFSQNNGRILVRDAVNTEIVRSYSYPRTLELEVNPATGAIYAVGDSVAQFAPLVEGVEIVDYVKDPRWFEGYLGQGAFLEVEKFFKFLVRVDGEAFNLSSLLFVKSFISRIKPTYTFPLTVVQTTIPTVVISTTDHREQTGTLRLELSPTTEWPEAGMWDHPRPSGGGYWGHSDEHGHDDPPVYPDPSLPVHWGYDQQGILPKYWIAATMEQVFAGGTPMFDGVFAFDPQQIDTTYAINGDHFIRGFGPLASAPYSIGGAIPSLATGTIGFLYVEIDGDDPDPINLTIGVYKNGVLATSIPFTKSPMTRDQSYLPLGLAVTAGDTLEVKVGTSSGYQSVRWHDTIVVFASGTGWSFDTPVPAGTYTAYRSL